MKTGCVVLNYNDYENTYNIVQIIVNYSTIDKILIVDNCSPDGSGRRLETAFIDNTKVTVLFIDENKGYASGNNAGVRYLYNKGYDYAIVCNPDVEFDEKFVNRCIAALNSGASLVSGIMRWADGSYADLHTYIIHTYIEDLLNCFFIGRKILNKKYNIILKTNDPNDLREVDRIPGSLMAININDFLGVNCFDENTFLYCEEKILCQKLKKERKRICLLTGIEYLHNESQTISKNYNVHQKIHLYAISNNYYYKTYRKIGPLKYRLLCFCERCYEFEFTIRDHLCRLLR